MKPTSTKLGGPGGAGAPPASKGAGAPPALWVKSCFSFLEGASHPEELVREAQRLGIAHMALTDRDGVYGAVRAHLAAKGSGLHLIHGAQLTLEFGLKSISRNNIKYYLDLIDKYKEIESNSSKLLALLKRLEGDGAGAETGTAPRTEAATEAATAAGTEVEIEGEGWELVALVEDAKGWEGLCRLITHGRRRAAKGACKIGLEELCDLGAGLTLLWTGQRAFARGHPRAAGDLGPLSLLEETALELAELRLLARLMRRFEDRLGVLIARHAAPESLERELRLRRQAQRLGLARVAGAELLYHSPARRPLHDILSCIRHGTNLERAGRLLRPNTSHALCSPAQFVRRFEDDPCALAAASRIAERCRFSLDELRYRYPDERLPSGMSSAQRLRQLSFEGARWRYEGAVPPEVEAQLERELELIEALDYPGYFLGMWEIVEFCRAQGILCQGRGSAANSAVCFCLGITAVDPVRMDLLFERFLSRERPEPPDIDLDIAHERREEVIQWVYETYGRSHAAMVAVFITYRTRSAIREVGKALGLPEAAMDRLAKLSHRHDGDWDVALQHAGLDPQAPRVQHLIRLVDELIGFPRHLSIHPGGFLLGQAPIHTLVPIENGAMEERTVIQWDKNDVDALGLFKVDLLGLGALAVVDRCLQMLRRDEGVALSLATLPAEDPETYEMCCRGDTVGVFQIESRAQMAMLPRLRPRTFYDLVIEVSIVRPGPIAGDMVHPYLRRRQGLEPVVYPHACLQPVLERTLGVPLFQEQVMKLAVVAADYTPGEADQLRRDMGAWRQSGRIEAHQQRLVGRMMNKGIEPAFAQRVFEQIRGFGEYGFPESHAASFALIAYATAWLKCHHPAAYVCALLNAQPMGFYSPATLVGDARRHQVQVLPIDITRSDWDCHLERLEEGVQGRAGGVQTPRRPPRGDDARHLQDLALGVRMGLRYVKGLPEALGRRLALENRLRPFRSLPELVARVKPDEGSLTRLAEAGAFECLGLSRREALWESRRLWRERTQSLPLSCEESLPAFAPLLETEQIGWDHAASRHSARGHPLEPLRALLRAKGLPDAAGLAALPDGCKARYAGLVIARQRPGTAGGVVFMTLEDETGFVNLVVWSDVYETYAIRIKTEPFLEVHGRVQRQEGVTHLVAARFLVPELCLQQVPPAPESHDFH